MIILDDDNNDPGITHSATERCSDDSPRQYIWRYDMATSGMVEARSCPVILKSPYEPYESILFYNMVKGDLAPSRYVSKYIRPYYANYVQVISAPSPKTLPEEKKQRTEDGKQPSNDDEEKIGSLILVCCLPYPAMANSFLSNFGMCWGFKRLWMNKRSNCIAVVEFEDEESASMAIDIFQGYEVRPLKTLIIYRPK